MIKVRKLDALYSPEIAQQLQQQQALEKNDSNNKLPRKSENSISRLIKAFEDKKERNRLESTDDRSTTDISLSRPLSSASVKKSAAPQAPSRTSEQPIEIVNRPTTTASNEEGGKKEEAASNIEKDFQTRISKLIKKFETTPDVENSSSATVAGATAQDATASIRSEPVKLAALRKTKSIEAEDTGDEVELSTSVRAPRGDLKVGIFNIPDTV